LSSILANEHFSFFKVGRNPPPDLQILGAVRVALQPPFETIAMKLGRKPVYFLIFSRSGHPDVRDKPQTGKITGSTQRWVGCETLLFLGEVYRELKEIGLARIFTFFGRFHKVDLQLFRALRDAPFLGLS